MEFKEVIKSGLRFVVGRRAEVRFSFDGDALEVRKLRVSCGCLKAILERGCVKVVFVPEGIPRHLAHQGFYDVGKSVVVEYGIDSKVELKFSGRVYAV